MLYPPELRARMTGVSGADAEARLVSTRVGRLREAAGSGAHPGRDSSLPGRALSIDSSARTSPGYRARPRLTNPVG